MTDITEQHANENIVVWISVNLNFLILSQIDSHLVYLFFLVVFVFFVAFQKMLVRPVAPSGDQYKNSFVLKKDKRWPNVWITTVFKSQPIKIMTPFKSHPIKNRTLFLSVAATVVFNVLIVDAVEVILLIIIEIKCKQSL